MPVLNFIAKYLIINLKMTNYNNFGTFWYGEYLPSSRNLVIGETLFKRPHTITRNSRPSYRNNPNSRPS